MLAATTLATREEPVATWLGSTAGMVAADGIAIVIGKALAEREAERRSGHARRRIRKPAAINAPASRPGSMIASHGNVSEASPGTPKVEVAGGVGRGPFDVVTFVVSGVGVGVGVGVAPVSGVGIGVGVGVAARSASAWAWVSPR